MSESDQSGNHPSRSRPVIRLLIRREDHIGDSLGLLFLEPETVGDDAIIAQLRDYLGPRARVLNARLSNEQIVVEIEGSRLTDEARHLSEAGEGLMRDGALRSAEALFKESLALNPVDAAAIRGLARLMAARQEPAQALDMLRRAREAGGDNPDLLLEMGQAAAKLGRPHTATLYLERALEMAPANLATRRLLSDLGAKPRLGRQRTLNRRSKGV